MTVVGKLVRLSWTERGYLAAAVLCLGAARFLVLALPFRRLARVLGTPRTESPADVSERRPGRLAMVTWGVTAAAARLPWRCLCLEQAVAASLILRRHGIPYTLYLGAARGERGLEAHAWLRAGRRILTGARGRERFVAVASFSWGGPGATLVAPLPSSGSESPASVVDGWKGDASVIDLAARLREPPWDTGSTAATPRHGR